MRSTAIVYRGFTLVYIEEHKSGYIKVIIRLLNTHTHQRADLTTPDAKIYIFDTSDNPDKSKK